MGDCGNIALVYPYEGALYAPERGEAKPVLEFQNPVIYLYSHWKGSQLTTVLAQALDLPWAKARYDDEAYLSRIIFQHVLLEAGGAPELQYAGPPGLAENWYAEARETGFGMSAYQTDNKHPIIYVLLGPQRVRIDGTEWSYPEYIARYNPAPAGV